MVPKLAKLGLGRHVVCICIQTTCAPVVWPAACLPHTACKQQEYLTPHLCGSADGQDALAHAHAVQARTGHICDCRVCVHHEAVPGQGPALQVLTGGLWLPAQRLNAPSDLGLLW